jgi:hypothetical protein
VHNYPKLFVRIAYIPLIKNDQNTKIWGYSNKVNIIINPNYTKFHIKYPNGFYSCNKQYHSDKGCKNYKTYHQLLALTFGKLCKCTTLSDISTWLSVSETFISDLVLKQNPSKSTMSDGNNYRN